MLLVVLVLDLKNWVKKVDADGNVIRNENDEPILRASLFC